MVHLRKNYGDSAKSSRCMTLRYKAPTGLHQAHVNVGLLSGARVDGVVVPRRVRDVDLTPERSVAVERLPAQTGVVAVMKAS